MYYPIAKAVIGRIHKATAALRKAGLSAFQSTLISEPVLCTKNDSHLIYSLTKSLDCYHVEEDSSGIFEGIFLFIVFYDHV